VDVEKFLIIYNQFKIFSPNEPGIKVASDVRHDGGIYET
jgi:hypothetical protein